MRHQYLFLCVVISALIALTLFFFNSNKFTLNNFNRIVGKLGEQQKEVSYEEARDIYEFKVLNYTKKWDFKKLMINNHVNLLDYTHDLMVLEQVILPLNNTKRLIPLVNQTNCSNSKFSKFLTGNARFSSANLIDVIIFGYELLTLEIRLYELYETVDEFVIFETNVTFKKLPKPFFFLHNKNRFKKFLNKITLISPFNITRYKQI